MALFKICRGAETNLPTTLTSGYCYFCIDTTNFYIDYTDTYGALTRAKIASKYADKLRYTEDGNFIELDPTDIVTKSNYETAIGVVTSDKNGLMSSSDKTKLDGVESGAQVNVQADWNQNDKTAPDYIKNRIGWWGYSRLQSVIGYCTDPIEDADLTSTYPGYTYWYGISSWFGGNTSSPLDLSYPCTLIGFEDFVVDEWKKITPSDTDENWGQVVVGDRRIIVIAEGGKITKIGSKTIWSDSYNHQVKFVQYDGERNPINLDLIRKTDFVTEGDPRLITSQGVKRYVDKYGQKVTIKTWTAADMT